MTTASRFAHPGYLRMLQASNRVRGYSVPVSDYAARVAYALSSRWGTAVGKR